MNCKILCWAAFACFFLWLLGAWSTLPVMAESEEVLADLRADSGADALTDGLDWNTREILASLGLLDLDESNHFTLSAVWETLGEALTDWIRAPMQLLASLLTATLVAALFQSLQGSHLQDSTARVLDYVITLTCACLLTPSLTDCFSQTESALNQGASFMLLFVPVFTAILAAGGFAGSAACYQAAVLALTDTFLQLICRVLLPLCTMCFGLALVDAVSPHVSVSGLLRLLKKAVSWAIGLVMTLFLGVLSLQNLLCNATDTAATKTAKYLVSSVVPVVGSAVSDAYSTVQSSLGILRSSTGVLGIAALCVFFLPPLMQLLLYRAVTAIGACVAELFGQVRLQRLFQGAGTALGIAFALLICFAVLFIVATAFGTMKE